MHTIVVPLDGSELSAQVLPYVRVLAPLLGVKVHLLRVIQEAHLSSGESWTQVLLSVYGVPERGAATRSV